MEHATSGFSWQASQGTGGADVHAPSTSTAVPSSGADGSTDAHTLAPVQSPIKQTWFAKKNTQVQAGGGFGPRPREVTVSPKLGS